MCSRVGGWQGLQWAEGLESLESWMASVLQALGPHVRFMVLLMLPGGIPFWLTAFSLALPLLPCVDSQICQPLCMHSCGAPHGKHTPSWCP